MTTKNGLLTLLCSILWVNLHGSGLLVPFCLAIRIWTCVPSSLQARAKSVAGSNLLPQICLLALIINPAGIRIFENAYQIASTGQTLGIREWMPLSFSPLQIFSLVGSGFLLVLQWKSPDRWQGTLSLFLSLLSLSSHRHWVYLLFPITVVTCELYKQISRAVRIPSLGILSLILFLLGFSKFWESPQAVPSIEKATRFLADVEIEGNCFNYPSWGSYLVYRLYPKVWVAHTMRLGVQRGVLLWEHEKWIQNGGLRMTDILEKWPETQFAILPSYWRHQNIFGKDWVRIYENDAAYIYLRKGALNKANFERVANYYKSRHIPFDDAKGLDLRTAWLSNPEWLKDQIEPGPQGRWPQKKARNDDLDRKALFGQKVSVTFGPTREGGRLFYWK